MQQSLSGTALACVLDDSDSILTSANIPRIKYGSRQITVVKIHGNVHWANFSTLEILVPFKSQKH